jgi:hypothetical protein
MLGCLQACTICGEATHRSWECPKEKQQLFVLPESIKAKVGELSLNGCGYCATGVLLVAWSQHLREATSTIGQRQLGQALPCTEGTLT